MLTSEASKCVSLLLLIELFSCFCFVELIRQGRWQLLDACRLLQLCPYFFLCVQNMND